MTQVAPARVRRLWTLVEPLHAVVYFAPEHRAAQDAAGLKGGWMAYFASRSAPLGPVPAEVVAAVFYGFAPAMVARAIPDAWRLSTPAAVLDARARSVEQALRRILTGVDVTTVARAGALLRQAMEGCDVAGRPLHAANAALPWPDEPIGALWHAATLVREHRGDGHVAALVAAGIDGCQSQVTAVAAGTTAEQVLRPHRGWSEEQWDAAVADLRARGLLASDSAAPTLTAAGNALRRGVEDTTDRLAAAPWRRLDDAQLRELESLLLQLARAVDAAGAVPYPNPIGVPRPAPEDGP